MDNDLHLSQHISRKFNQELEQVRSQVLKMGGIVEQQVSDGLTALLNADMDLAKVVADREHQVNLMEVEIDETCTETDLERIGDEAEKLGVNALSISKSKGSERHFLELKNLGESVLKMLNRALNAYARMDVKEALEVIESDKNVNAEFENVSRLLVIKMMEDPRMIKGALSISWCARALERIGDHAKNICEYIVYLVKGKDVRHISLDDIRKQIQ